jgi:hypothetical protein
MSLARPALAHDFICRRCLSARRSRSDPRRFGRGVVYELSATAQPRRSLSPELKLFATTFVAGFLFVSVLIG